MGENSKIEWTDHTFNPWVGCTKISPGCDHCYAEGWAKRSGLVTWGGERRRTSAAYWRQPAKWNAEAQRDGVRRRVFCASLADVFDNEVPPEWRTDLFRLIYATPHLSWLLLTKRIGNVPSALRVLGDNSLPPNVWLGITVVNQEEAERDIPKLLHVPATIRFLSCEPLLGAIDFDHEWLESETFGHASDCHNDLCALNGDEFSCDGHIYRQDAIDWIIVGGESGAGARPFVLEYGKEIVRQCQNAGVPVFVKQVGSRPVNREGERCAHILDRKGKVMEEWPEELRVREFPMRVEAVT